MGLALPDPVLVVSGLSHSPLQVYGLGALVLPALVVMASGYDLRLAVQVSSNDPVLYE